MLATTACILLLYSMLQAVGDSTGHILPFDVDGYQHSTLAGYSRQSWVALGAQPSEQHALSCNAGVLYLRLGLALG